MTAPLQRPVLAVLVLGLVGVPMQVSAFEAPHEALSQTSRCISDCITE